MEMLGAFEFDHNNSSSLGIFYIDADDRGLYKVSLLSVPACNDGGIITDGLPVLCLDQRIKCIRVPLDVKKNPHIYLLEITFHN